MKKTNDYFLEQSVITNTICFYFRGEWCFSVLLWVVSMRRSKSVLVEWAADFTRRLLWTAKQRIVGWKHWNLHRLQFSKLVSFANSVGSNPYKVKFYFQPFCRRWGWGRNLIFQPSTKHSSFIKSLLIYRPSFVSICRNESLIPVLRMMTKTFPFLYSRGLLWFS